MAMTVFMGMMGVSSRGYTMGAMMVMVGMDISIGMFFLFLIILCFSPFRLLVPVAMDMMMPVATSLPMPMLMPLRLYMSSIPMVEVDMMSHR